MYVCVCLHVFMCTKGIRVPMEARRWRWVPQNWNVVAGTGRKLLSHLASLSPLCGSLVGHVCVLASCLLGNTALGFEYDFFLEGLYPT